MGNARLRNAGVLACPESPWDIILCLKPEASDCWSDVSCVPSPLGQEQGAEISKWSGKDAGDLRGDA